MRLLAAAFLVGGAVGAASACLVALVPPEAASDDGLAALKVTFRRPDGVPFPRDNTFSERKRALGEALFHDKRLSADGSLACAGCHDRRNDLVRSRSVALVVDQHTRALPRQLQCRRTPDSARCAGDDGNLIAEQHGRAFSQLEIIRLEISLTLDL